MASYQPQPDPMAQPDPLAALRFMAEWAARGDEVRRMEKVLVQDDATSEARTKTQSDTTGTSQSFARQETEIFKQLAISEGFAQLGTERQQLVDDSKFKLEQQLLCTRTFLEMLESITSKLQTLVEKYEGDLQEVCEGLQQSAMRESQGSKDHNDHEAIGCGSGEDVNVEQSGKSGEKRRGDRNEKKEGIGPGSGGDDDKESIDQGHLQMLLDTERQLRRLMSSGRGTRLWKQISMDVRLWYVEGCKDRVMDGEGKFPRKLIDNGFQISCHFLPFLLTSRYRMEIEKIMQQIHVTEIRVKQHPQILAQQLTTFRNSLHQFQVHIDFLQCQREHMEVIMEDWQERGERQTLPGKQLNRRRTRSIGDIGMVRDPVNQPSMPHRHRRHSLPDRMEHFNSMGFNQSGKEMQQLVADSKTKLEEQLKCMRKFLTVLKQSKSKLQKLVEKYEGDLQEACEGLQHSVIRESQGSRYHNDHEAIGFGNGEEANEEQPGQSGGKRRGDRNENQKGMGSSNGPNDGKESINEGELHMSLDIEKHLNMVRNSENGTRLWEDIGMNVRKWCQEKWNEKEVKEEKRKVYLKVVDRILNMMWNNNDSLFLWEFRYAVNIQNIMQQIYPTEIRAEQHQHSLVDREQQSATFKNRLRQRQDHIDFLQRQCTDMKAILESWPGHCEKQTLSWVQLYKKMKGLSKSTEEIEMVGDTVNLSSIPHRRRRHSSPNLIGHRKFMVQEDAVFSVAIETAFPRCAIIRLKNSDLKMNSASLSSLQDGSAYARQGRERPVVAEWLARIRDGRLKDKDGRDGVDTYRITAGSRAEGLAIEVGWGHPEADVDTMLLYGGPLGVHVPGGRQPQGRAALAYRPEGCPPGYCKIEVTDVQKVMKTQYNESDLVGERCVHWSEGVPWLHTYNMVRWIQPARDNVSGPAGQLDNLSEWVPTLVGSDAHPDMDQNYLLRFRHGWPSRQQLKVIKQLLMLYVLTGHKLSHPNEIPLQARFSWSPAEMVLIMELSDNIKQAYIAAKYTFKYFMKCFRGSGTHVQGRSTVGSFHLKTVFLHLLEHTPPQMLGSQLHLMLGLLSDLDGHLKKGKLPHYFLPDCDLLATVKPEERHIACDVIRHILSDPLRAILTCPIEPKEIYGKIRPDTLVAAFRQVSSHPTSITSREHLLRLLRSLDETRQRRYQEQQKKDHMVVSGRPKLVGLADMLKKQLLMQEY